MATDTYPSPWRRGPPSAPPSAPIQPQQQNTPRTFYRGRGRGRGRGGYHQAPAQYQGNVVVDPSPPDRDLLDGLHKERKGVIARPEDDNDHQDLKITDCTFLGSYNWVESKESKETPTILVPGSPPHWINRATPYTIRPDLGKHLSDQNGMKLPRAVLLPLIVAVNKCSSLSGRPAFDWTSADVVTDRNNLRKLTRWVEGGEPGSDFRIDIQLAGEKTLLLSRWSDRYWHSFTGRTFGFSFEQAATDFAPGCKDSTGHHRIVSYDLDGMKMVVRFEVDACLRPPVQSPRKSLPASDENLNESLSGVAISTVEVSKGGEYPVDYPLLVREGGTEVPIASVIELATRSERTLETRGYDWKDTFPQLFFSQTAHYYVGVHNRGTFSRIEKKKLRELGDVDKVAQKNLRKVRVLLEQIRDLVVQNWKDKRLSLVMKDAVLGVYERRAGEIILPEVALAFFNPRTVQGIEVPHLTGNEEDIRVYTSRYIGSYNWTKQDNSLPAGPPAILVPGSARIWSPQGQPVQLTPDVGVQVLDEDAYRMPNTPLLPLVVAVERTHEKKGETFEWKSVDFVTDRKCISQLAQWVNRESQLDDFRIELQLAGEKTILMSRWSEKDRVAITQDQYKDSFRRPSLDKLKQTLNVKILSIVS